MYWLGAGLGMLEANTLQLLAVAGAMGGHGSGEELDGVEVAVELPVF
jgi:hypothetical protein